MKKNPVRFLKKKSNMLGRIIIDNHKLRRYFDQKRTLLIMISSLGGGGAQKVATILASALCDYYHVTVVYFNEKENAYPLDERVEVLCPPWRKMNLGDMRLYLRMLKRIHRFTASISFMFDSNEKNTWDRSGTKIICCERNNPIKKAPELFAQTAEQYRKADHVIFQSKLVQQLYDDEVRSHSSILPNPVNVSCEAAPVSTHRIVTAGRLHPQKNHEMLIRAFAAFAKDHPDYTLSIYGEGELKEKLQAVIEEQNMSGKVHLCGLVDDICPAIADAEMFVLSSDYEGLSNALLEAMMMGIPCISTECEGSVDVIRSGENGLLVPIGDEHALCEAMCLLADDPEKRAAIAGSGKETGAAFRTDVVVRQWVDLIEKIVAE